MINLKSIEQIYSGCGFVHALIKRKVKQCNKTKPKKISLDKVTRCVKRYGKINRRALIEKSGLSSFGVDSCIHVLVNSGELIETCVGKSGPYQLCVYSLPGKS